MIAGGAGGRRAVKVSDVLARQIVQDISSNDLAVGAMLPSESVMLEHYKISRASLREALRILEVHGLITMKPGPGGGPVVAASDSRDFGRMSTLHYQMERATFRDLVEARLTMEPLMAARAAKQGDPALLSALIDVSERTRQALPDPERFNQCCADFHGIVAAAAGNPILSLFTTSLKDVYAERVTAIAMPLDQRKLCLAEHDSITTAVRKGEATRADRLMRKHVHEFVWRSVEDRYPGLLDEIVDWR